MNDYQKEYSRLLKDPRWGWRRFQILMRDHFACRRCGHEHRDAGDPTISLHVHHKKYIYGCKPWEYDDCDLETLCQLCHEAEHCRQDRDRKRKASETQRYHPQVAALIEDTSERMADDAQCIEGCDVD